MDPAVPGAEHQIDLREYLAILRARKWTIILITALVVGSALFFSMRQTPIYESEARLLVKALPNSSGFALPPNLATEAQLVSSVPVATKVQEDLGLAESPQALIGSLIVEPTTDLAQVLSIRFSSPDPTIAQAAANSFAESYIEFRREEADEALAAAREAIQDRVDSLTQQLTEMAGEIEQARGEDDDSLANTLEAQRSVLIARLGVLQQRLDDVQPDRTISIGGGEVIQPAALPGQPASPDIIKNVLLALFLGLALGIGLAFLRERLDDRLRGRSDLERSLEIPVLATVPRFPTSKKRGRELVTLADPHGSASEAYRSLRTNLQYLLEQRDLKSLLVTSAAAGEGKTVTCANLAIALARSGRKVMLVSADLRRPTLESYFDLPRNDGLSSWLATPDKDLWRFVSDPGIDNLRVMTTGPVPHMPAELLTSRRLGQLIDALENNCDIVLVDSPPTLAVADATILAAHVGGTLLVVDAHKTLRSAAMRAAEELNRVGAGLLGIILNAFDATASPYYYQSYGYGSGYRSAARPSEGNGAPADARPAKKSRRLSFRR